METILVVLRPEQVRWSILETGGNIGMIPDRPGEPQLGPSGQAAM